MDDYKLMMMKMRGEDRMREAKQGLRAAEARRAAHTTQTTRAAGRGPLTRLALRLATAVVRTRPATTGR